MPEPLHGLSSGDVAVLRRLIAWAEKQGLNTRGRFPRERQHAENDDHQAPEVYVAKTPAGGIDGLTLGDGGTGTGGYDEPGSATCDIYVIDETDTVPDLRDMGKDVIVYNVSGVAVPGSAYVPIVRDKSGRWLAVTPPIGTRRRFKLKDALVADDHATAYLVEASGGSLTATDTEFEVYDGMSEFEGDAGTLGMAEWWDDMARWEVYQMACDASDAGTGTGTP